MYMNKKDYQTMYEKMDMSNEMDQQIKDAIKNTQMSKRTSRKSGVRAALSAVAAIALIVGVSRTDVVRAAVDKIVHYFTYSFSVEQKDGTTEKVQMKEEYLTLSKDAPKEDLNMNSISEVGDAIGIHLLDTKEAYQYDGCIEYDPKVSKDGKLYGIVISDKLYATGDLKDVKLYPKEEEDGRDFLFYSTGENYQTPILVQISLRTDENITKEYKDNELGFVSTRMNIDLSNDTSDMYDAEVYELKNLGVKAVLYTVDTDGPINWGIESGNISCTNAVFVYKGVEYVYMGGVSHDTMKQFLNTLE